MVVVVVQAPALAPARSCRPETSEIKPFNYREMEINGLISRHTG